MSRDVVSIALVLVGCFKVWLAWLQVRSYRVKRGRWWRWPLTIGWVRRRRWPLRLTLSLAIEWLLAGVFASVAILLTALGWLLWHGEGPLPWWSVAIVANVAFWHVLLGWGLAHVRSEPECVVAAIEQDEP